MIKTNITTYYILDSMNHPVKSIINMERTEKRIKAKTTLQSFCNHDKSNSATLSDDKYAKAMKNIKAISIPNLYVL